MATKAEIKKQDDKAGKIILVAVIVVGLSVGGYFLYKHLKKKPEPTVETPPTKEPTKAPVKDEAVTEAYRNLNFKSGTAVIQKGSYASLEELADLLRKRPTWKLNLVGYTDDQGNKQANLVLSKARAESVFKFLASEPGVKAGNISFKGEGEENPIATNKTAEGRAKNRRVEFKLLKA